MKLLRVIASIGTCLLLQAALGRFWADAHRYVDLLLVPVVVYGLIGTQRSAMLVGCAAGLIHDTWFQLGTLGLYGFKRTLIGWLFGGLGSRFDLNHPTGRWVGGALASLIDSLLDGVLRNLLDRGHGATAPADLLIRAAVTGVLVVLAFAVTERFRSDRPGRHS